MCNFPGLSAGMTCLRDISIGWRGFLVCPVTVCVRWSRDRSASCPHQQSQETRPGNQNQSAITHVHYQLSRRAPDVVFGFIGKKPMNLVVYIIWIKNQMFHIHSVACATQKHVQLNLSNWPSPQIDRSPIWIDLFRSQMIAHADILTP